MAYRVPRRTNFAPAITIAASLVLACAIAIRSWALMILIGILHAETGFPPRTVGFWISIPLAILITIVVANVQTKAD